MRIVNHRNQSESSIHAPEGVANPRTLNVDAAFFCSCRDDKVRTALKTTCEVAVGKEMRLER